MRHVTEQNALLLEEVLAQRIEELQSLHSHSLRLANKIRLLQLAQAQLKNSKTVKNGKANNK
jgi:hypothetical protein